MLRPSRSNPYLALHPLLTLHYTLATPGFFLSLHHSKLGTSFVPLHLPFRPAWDTVPGLHTAGLSPNVTLQGDFS